MFSFFFQISKFVCRNQQWTIDVEQVQNERRKFQNSFFFIFVPTHISNTTNTSKHVIIRAWTKFLVHLLSINSNLMSVPAYTDTCEPTPFIEFPYIHKWKTATLDRRRLSWTYRQIAYFRIFLATITMYWFSVVLLIFYLIYFISLEFVSIVYESNKIVAKQHFLFLFLDEKKFLCLFTRTCLCPQKSIYNRKNLQLLSAS